MREQFTNNVTELKHCKEELKEVSEKYEKLVDDHEKTCEKLMKTEVELEQKTADAKEYKFQAEGALEAMEGMRKEVNEMVEMQCMEREQKYEKI